LGGKPPAGALESTTTESSELDTRHSSAPDRASSGSGSWSGAEMPSVGGNNPIGIFSSEYKLAKYLASTLDPEGEGRESIYVHILKDLENSAQLQRLFLIDSILEFEVFSSIKNACGGL
jgi:hypothetical protein